MAPPTMAAAREKAGRRRPNDNINMGLVVFSGEGALEGSDGGEEGARGTGIGIEEREKWWAWDWRRGLLDRRARPAGFRLDR